jgi:ABC-2 type transport system ATP-binding protein
MPIVEAKGLTKRFGDLAAVDDINLSVEDGEVFGLLGPNGAGKTTVIKMLATLLPPTSGTAVVSGFDVYRHPTEVRRLIGYVPQILSADGQLTGYENLLVFAKLYDVERHGREEKLRKALEVMGIADAANRLVRTYSGGMIRRLEIAQSMIHRPRILFLDEPTIGLDPKAREAVWEHIARLRAEYGTTILLTTHYMEEADHLCGRVAIMHLGKIAALGTPSDLKKSISADGNGTNVTLNDVFFHFTKGTLDSGGSYRDTSRTRKTARRLG